MNTKHTPGPWEVYNGEVTTEQKPGRSYRRIASFMDYGIEKNETAEANARLIAAAPELLGVLKDILQYLSCEQDDKARRIAYGIVQNMILKAEGK